MITSKWCRIVSHWTNYCMMIVVVFTATTWGDDSELFIEISGALPSRLVAQKKPYLAITDLYVGPGVTVVLEAGVVILFESFTGLHLQGTLLALGNDTLPVIFSSKNDRTLHSTSSLNAAPYDWNGIDIYESALGTRLEHSTIAYSVYGIRSQTPHVRLRSCTFRANGKANFSVLDKEMQVDTEPFSFNLPEANEQRRIVALNPVAQKTPTRQLVLRFSALGAAVLGTTIGALWTGKLIKSTRNFEKIQMAAESGDHSTYIAKDWDDAKKKKGADTFWTITGYSLCLLGVTGFSLTFTY